MPLCNGLDVLLDDSTVKLSPQAELSVHSALLLALTYRQPGHPRMNDAAQRVGRLLNADLDVNQKLSAAISLLAGPHASGAET